MYSKSDKVFKEKTISITSAWNQIRDNWRSKTDKIFGNRTDDGLVLGAGGGKLPFFLNNPVTAPPAPPGIPESEVLESTSDEPQSNTDFKERCISGETIAGVATAGGPNGVMGDTKLS